jgi:2-polyprenyl-6-methoxyphenol hydroxylase-like FAD-dependent oxidoreductase
MRDVLIVGGGPVGTFLAALLADRGVDVVVWERRETPAALSRAIGIHPPSLDAFLRIDVADAVVEAAVRIRRGVARSNGRTLGSVSFDRVSSRFPFVAALPQCETEEIIAGRLEALAPGAVQRGVELVALDDVDPAQVRAQGRSASGDVYEVARYVVGADGARSAVRRLLGLRAASKQYGDAFAMGDFADETPDGSDAVIYLEGAGVVESFPLPGGMRRYVVRTGAMPGRPTPDEVADLVRSRTGATVDPATNTMLSSFATRRRIVEHMVRGRIVLIGDSAHEISPIGGQGMNLGWLDAAALAPILSAWVRRDGVPTAGLAEFEERRLALARRAARQAEANMALGRPVRGLRHVARDAGFGLALATPASRVLARRYAMS